jgi:hypothetical protein
MCVKKIGTDHKHNIIFYTTVYFLSVTKKQSDWLRSLSERGGFLHAARSETQLPAVKCNCPLWFSRQKMRSETIFKRKNLPKTFEKRSLTIYIVTQIRK